MTETLLEPSADNGAQKVFQLSDSSRQWQYPSDGEGCRTTFLQLAIGREIRSLRARHGMAAIDLATSAGISAGTLSKVENGSISPSLNTLQALASALGVPVTALFRRSGGKNRAVLVKADAGVPTEPRDTRTCHRCHLLGDIDCSTSGVRIQPCLVTLSNAEDEFPAFEHKGLVFIYMLEGELICHHGDSLYRLTPGDSFLFEADGRHGPGEFVTLPIRFVWVSSCRVPLASG